MDFPGADDSVRRVNTLEPMHVEELTKRRRGLTSSDERFAPAEAASS